MLEKLRSFWERLNKASLLILFILLMAIYFLYFDGPYGSQIVGFSAKGAYQKTVPAEVRSELLYQLQLNDYLDKEQATELPYHIFIARGDNGIIVRSVYRKQALRFRATALTYHVYAEEYPLLFVADTRSETLSLIALLDEAAQLAATGAVRAELALQPGPVLDMYEPVWVISAEADYTAGQPLVFNVSTAQCDVRDLQNSAAVYEREYYAQLRLLDAQGGIVYQCDMPLAASCFNQLELPTAEPPAPNIHRFQLLYLFKE